MGHKAQDIPGTSFVRLGTRDRRVEDFGFVMDVVIVTSGLAQLVLSTAALSESILGHFSGFEIDLRTEDEHR